jgi:hypothetical protein
VQLPINKDLPFSNISSEIGDGMGDIIILNNKNVTGIDKMGIWVIDPFLPCTLPALSYIVDKSV